MAENLTAAEIAQYRQALQGSPEALETLDLIEAMDGNIEGALGLLAPQHGIEFTRADDEPLEKLTQKFRKIICDDDFMELVIAGLLTAAVTSLATVAAIPAPIATPIVLYIAKKGVKKWCSTQA